MEMIYLQRVMRHWDRPIQVQVLVFLSLSALSLNVNIKVSLQIYNIRNYVNTKDGFWHTCLQSCRVHLSVSGLPHETEGDFRWGKRTLKKDGAQNDVSESLVSER